MEGIANGFRLVNLPGFCQVEQENYRSATCAENREAVEKQILTELVENRYVVVDWKPTIVSALGAIVKSGGGIRLIHDASRPEDLSLNSYAVLESKQKFETIDNAEALLKKDYFMAKLDLKAAYRSVRVHESQYSLTGIKWTFSGDQHPTYMVDTRLPFGARFSPGIFHKLTQSVKHMMETRGFNGLVVYLDDFLIVESSKQRCLDALNTLISLVRVLGFSVAWDKVCGPAQNLTFLGVELDSRCMRMRLPGDKVDDFCTLIDEFVRRSRVSLRQCQRLAGRINWAAQVYRIGRNYLRRLFEAMKPLKSGHHKMRLSCEAKEDILWWKQVLKTSNGVRLIQWDGPVHTIYAETSAGGAGMLCGSDWRFILWQADMPDLANQGAIDKEVATLALALLNWTPQCRDSTVVLCSQNKGAVNNLCRGQARYKPVGDLVNVALHWAAMYNIRLVVEVAPVECFDIVHCICHLYEPGQLFNLESLLGRVVQPLMQICELLLTKMSLPCLCTIFLQVQRWRDVKKIWYQR